MADLKKAAENLRARGFAVQLFQTGSEAADYLDRAVDGKTVGFGGSVTLQQLGLYSRNAPFSGEAWLLIGTVAQNDLYRFSHSVRNLLVMAALLTAVVGLGCSVAVARQLAKPVAQLSNELARAQKDHVSVPEFSRTGIRELDQFASAIVQLSRENEEATALERRRIEHERDYDILTGLYNRQAFQRVCENLFAKPETLGHAALLMTDLDNLKTINDTYGHDWGDQYLRQTGRCLAASTPPGTLSARLSGDEFMLLLYGYDSREAVREELEKLRAALQDSASILPSGSELRISISGGVAWYPEDSTDFNTLKKYADFAMYQVKHSRKGEMKEFDIGMYNQEAYALQTRNEFEQMLRDQAYRHAYITNLRVTMAAALICGALKLIDILAFGDKLMYALAAWVILQLILVDVIYRCLNRKYSD